MPGGQAVTSGQGSVVQSRDKAATGLALTSGAGTIVADAGSGIAVTGEQSTAGQGTAAGGAIVFLRSRKVGGGSAAALLGGQGISSGHSSLGVSPSRQAVGVLLGGSQGAFGKTRDRALSGSALTASQGSPIAGIRFAWDANPSGDNVTTYRLYYGAASGVYNGSGSPVSVGNVTTYIFPTPGVSRYYALTAVNSTGESSFSNEIFT